MNSPLKKEEEKNRYFQNIILKFSSGKEIKASVPAFCNTEEELENLHITDIKVTRPKEFPKGVNFQTLD